MFNKRHYQAIATVMQEICPELPTDSEGNYDDDGYDHDALGRQLMWDDMCDVLARMFSRDNGLFKHDRFMAACKPGANVKGHCEKTIRRSP